MTVFSDSKEIKVIGSGVSGLTTGLALQEHGYNVSIIARDHFKNTVSANAAAIWFPYEARPIDKVLEWSNHSYTKFLELSGQPKSGVSIISCKVYEPADIFPFWINALPSESKLNQETIHHLGSDFICYTYTIPLIETQIYLPFLHDAFLSNGGSIYYEEIKDFKSFPENTLLINCTGLGAKELCDDQKLYPIQGQTVKIEPSENRTGIIFDEFPIHTENEITYIIPRSDCTVLGGSAFNNDNSKKKDTDLAHRIVDRCIKLVPDLESKKILSTQVGLRPGRSEIRLERELKTSVIHNYGHGGAGFTVSWGCASEVLGIVQKYFDDV
ncbi:MAG: FAD-dependent oxidoreductase [Balneola sp.]